jgi:group I intron endonuclease
MNKHDCGIYAITNIVTNKAYVGKTETNFTTRKQQHWSTLENNLHYNELLQADWNRYGSSAFDFIILEVVERTISKHALAQKEQAYIDQFGSNCYNLEGANLPDEDEQIKDLEYTLSMRIPMDMYLQLKEIAKRNERSFNHIVANMIKSQLE